MIINKINLDRTSLHQAHPKNIKDISKIFKGEFDLESLHIRQEMRAPSTNTDHKGKENCHQRQGEENASYTSK